MARRLDVSFPFNSGRTPIQIVGTPAATVTRSFSMRLAIDGAERSGPGMTSFAPVATAAGRRGEEADRLRGLIPGVGRLRRERPEVERAGRPGAAGRSEVRRAAAGGRRPDGGAAAVGRAGEGGEAAAEAFGRVG